MNSFYLVLLVLLSVTIGFLWWQSRRADNHKRLAIRQLAKDLQTPDLPPRKRAELQQQLANAIVRAGKIDTRAWWVPALLITLGGLLLYQKIGTPSATDTFVYAAGSTSNRNISISSTPPDMEAAIAALKKRIEADPDNVDNHVLYGRAMMAMKNYTEAVSAYETARRLQPESAWVLASLAEAKAFAAGQGNFRGEPEALLSQALALDPDNQKALWLMGMNAFEQGKPELAEQLWTRLLARVENPRVAEQLKSQIALVRQQQDKPAEIQADKATGKANVLAIQVGITPEMQSQLGNRPAVLYVYAKQVGGPPMPIAVARSNVSDFPRHVVLGDANSLRDNRPLSSFEQISIGARISFSGNAMPQPGDIESDEITIPITGQTEPVQLELNKIR